MEQRQCKSPHFEVFTDEKFIDINIEKAEVDKTHIFLRASQHGKPEYVSLNQKEKTNNVVKVADKKYVNKKHEAI